MTLSAATVGGPEAAPFSGAAALRVDATAPGLTPGLAAALLMAPTVAAVAAPRGGRDVVAGNTSGGTVAAGWAEDAGADNEAARTGRISAADVSAARGVCAAEPPGARIVRASRLLYTLPELGRDSLPLSSLGLRLCPAPALESPCQASVDLHALHSVTGQKHTLQVSNAYTSMIQRDRAP